MRQALKPEAVLPIKGLNRDGAASLRRGDAVGARAINVLRPRTALS
jgi:hypothetical protein